MEIEDTEAPEGFEDEELEDLEDEDEDLDLDSANILPALERSNPEWVKKLVSNAYEECIDHYDASKKARDRIAETWELITGYYQRQDKPWEGAMDAKMYSALERVHRVSSRLYSELFMENKDIFRAEAQGQDPQEQLLAQMRTMHLNYQLREEQTDFLRYHKRGTIAFCAEGTTFSHSGYDPVKKRAFHEILTYDDLIIPYSRVTIAADMSDCSFIAQRLFHYSNELEDLEESGEYVNVDKILASEPSEDDEFDDDIRAKMERLEGWLRPDKTSSAPYTFLKYSGSAKLPGADRSVPICLIFETSTKTPVRLYVRDIDDPRDRARYNAQYDEAEQYQRTLSAIEDFRMRYQAALVEWQQMGGPMSGAPMPQPPQIQPPPPPRWMAEGNTDPEPVRRIPLNLYARADFIENLHGMMTISPGVVCASLQKVEESAMNQFIDSAQFGNSSMYFALPGTFKRNQKFGPGQVVEMKSAIDPEKAMNAFREIRPTGANPQMLDVGRIMNSKADSAISAPAVLSGEPGKSGETARGVMFRGEQATKTLTTPGLSYIGLLEQQVKNQVLINYLYLPDDTVYYVAGKGPQRISRHIYDSDFKVHFTADIRFAGQQQRTVEAQGILEMVSAFPPLQNNPAFVHAAFSNYFRAIGRDDFVSLLGQPPPPPEQFGPPPQPPGMQGAPGEQGQPPEGEPPAQ